MYLEYVCEFELSVSMLSVCEWVCGHCVGCRVGSRGEFHYACM